MAGARLGPEPGPQAETAAKDELFNQFADNGEMTPASHQPARQQQQFIYQPTNTKLRRRGKKSCAGLILQTFWSHHQYLHRLCGHGWTCTDPMSRVPLYTIPVHRVIELQTNLREGYAKFYNHGEGPYLPCLAQCLKCENASMHFQPGEDPSSRGLLCDEIFT